MNTVWEYVVPVIAGLVGYGVSHFNERLQSSRFVQQEHVLKSLEDRLQKFLWPIFFLLHELIQCHSFLNQKDLVVYGKRIIHIIHDNIIYGADDDTLAAVLNYIQQFNTWQRSHDGDYPLRESENLLDHLQTKIAEHQEKYNEFLGDRSARILRYHRGHTLPHLTERRVVPMEIQDPRAYDNPEEMV